MSASLEQAKVKPADLREAMAAIANEYNPSSDKARQKILALMRETMLSGRDRARKRLDETGRGRACAEQLSDLQDVIVRALFDYAVNSVYRAANPSDAEHLTVIAVGGYGRGTMAPESDVDLLFLFPYKVTAWAESVTEYVLYALWDLGLKVGHGTRTVNECIKMAKDDMTIRTALLESRHICGDETLFDELMSRFDSEIVAGTARDFISAKLAERDNRHTKAGTSRYLVEPNVKDGKGGLRDLQTLFWIAKYHYRVRSREALVDAGLLRSSEYQLFRKCEDFLWAVRCQLHFITRRAEERVSFDVQADLAAKFGYQKHPGLIAVERFMKHYFLIAKDVGDLTRIVCAGLEERQQKRTPTLDRLLRPFLKRRRKIAESTDFIIDNNRITIAEHDVFDRDPVNLIRIFRLAQKHDLTFHPDAMWRITQSLKKVDRKLRADPEANRLFLEILTTPDRSEGVLRRMNETGVLGRFIPDFGKIVAMMQFNMYHHFTVDEHLLTAIGIFADMERGRLGDDHPLVHELMPQIEDKTVLYVAILLHDIAKGRPEDHSVAGAKLANRLCPRLGLNRQQTERVAWLVREHLTMSIVAQSRDLADRKTILDFAQTVQSMDRLKELLILTVCDIRAVGPGVWNGWKGQLLRTLYYETESVLTGEHKRQTQKELADQARDLLADRLMDWPDDERQNILDLHYPAYLVRVDIDTQLRHAELVRQAGDDHSKLHYAIRPMAFEGATEITVLTNDHPSLVAITAGACSAAGANIVDAQIHTTTDGRALNTIIVSRAFNEDSDELRRGRRIANLIEKALEGTLLIRDLLARKRQSPGRREAFSVKPEVTISNELSNRFTVIDISALDRSGLLYDVANALGTLNLNIASAHIATFGERASDSFYVTDLLGQKITSKSRQGKMRRTLLAALDPSGSKARSKADPA